jgi:hypothetical protein
MDLFNFIENHWKILSFIISEISVFIAFAYAMIQAVKCLLRNDILAIYDRCKEDKKITRWQLDSIEKSYKLYKFFKGNSFVKNLVERVEEFELID